MKKKNQLEILRVVMRKKNHLNGGNGMTNRIILFYQQSIKLIISLESKSTIAMEDDPTGSYLQIMGLF